MERQGGGAKTVRGGEERDVRRERGVPTLARVSERGFDTSPRRRATSSNLGTYRSFYAHLTPTDSVSRRENKSLLRRVSSGTRDRQNRRLRAARRSLRALTSPSLCSTRNTAASDDIAGSGLGFFPPASSRAKAKTPPPRECAFQSNANASSPGISVAGNAANPAECRPSRRRKSASSFSFPTTAEGFRLERVCLASRSSALASSSTLGGYGPTSRAPRRAARGWTPVRGARGTAAGARAAATPDERADERAPRALRVATTTKPSIPRGFLFFASDASVSSASERRRPSTRKGGRFLFASATTRPRGARGTTRRRPDCRLHERRSRPPRGGPRNAPGADEAEAPEPWETLRRRPRGARREALGIRSPGANEESASARPSPSPRAPPGRPARERATRGDRERREDARAPPPSVEGSLPVSPQRQDRRRVSETTRRASRRRPRRAIASPDRSSDRRLREGWSPSRRTTRRASRRRPRRAIASLDRSSDRRRRVRRRGRFVLRRPRARFPLSLRRPRRARARFSATPPDSRAPRTQSWTRPHPRAPRAAPSARRTRGSATRARSRGARFRSRGFLNVSPPPPTPPPRGPRGGPPPSRGAPRTPPRGPPAQRARRLELVPRVLELPLGRARGGAEDARASASASAGLGRVPPPSAFAASSAASAPPSPQPPPPPPSPPPPAFASAAFASATSRRIDASSADAASRRRRSVSNSASASRMLRERGALPRNPPPLAPPSPPPPSVVAPSPPRAPPRVGSAPSRPPSRRRRPPPRARLGARRSRRRRPPRAARSAASRARTRAASRGRLRGFGARGGERARVLVLARAERALVHRRDGGGVVVGGAAFLRDGAEAAHLGLEAVDERVALAEEAEVVVEVVAEGAELRLRGGEALARLEQLARVGGGRGRVRERALGRRRRAAADARVPRGGHPGAEPGRGDAAGTPRGDAARARPARGDARHRGGPSLPREAPRRARRERVARGRFAGAERAPSRGKQRPARHSHMLQATANERAEALDR